MGAPALKVGCDVRCGLLLKYQTAAVNPVSIRTGLTCIGNLYQTQVWPMILHMLLLVCGFTAIVKNAKEWL